MKGLNGRRDAFWARVFADENRRYWSIAGTILVTIAFLYTLLSVWWALD